MKKIDFGKLAVSSYKQDEIIAWLADSTACLVKDFQDAILSNNMGEVGVVCSELVVLAGVAKALNEDVNGKKEATVV